MPMLTAKKVLHIMVLAFASFGAVAQVVKEPAETPKEWSRHYKPFRIAGNLYFVGTYDLCSYLITTPGGHILINTGLANSAEMIQANVEELGFRFSDIKILLNSQAHFDHLGAMAAIKEATGAKLMVNENDAIVVGDGGFSDYLYGGMVSKFRPVQVDRILRKQDTIKLGGMKVIALHHPGHTKGSTSFLFDVRDEKRTYKVLIANMPSVLPEASFPSMPTYHDIGKDYAYTFASLPRLKFDIWLAAHASQCGLHKKHKEGDAYNPWVFMDRPGYDSIVSDLQADYLERVNGDE